MSSPRTRRSGQQRLRSSAVAAGLLSAVLGGSWVGFATVAHADRTRTLGDALRGGANGPLALAATRVFAPLDEGALLGPRLEAPDWASELDRSWSVAPDSALSFDGMAAVLQLAAVLNVVPALPRLDGRARPVLTRDGASALTPPDAACPPAGAAMLGATSCDRVVDAATLAAAGGDGSAAPPGAELRGAGSRLLRSFGLGSISGQPVWMIDGADDPAAAARQDLDPLAWLGLPPRPWQGPEVDDDLAAFAVRSRHGRGAMGFTTKLTIRSAALRLIGTF